jgi:AcrR family transcriptional regulator
MPPRGEQTRARLLDAAAAVVGRVGYARATTRMIAEEAGVAEGTIYRHFPDKQALFLTAVLERNAPVVAAVEALPAQAGTRTVRDNLVECLTSLASLRDEIVPLELAVLADPDLAAAQRHAAERGVATDPHRALGAYLAAEQRLGRIRADVDPDQTGLLLLLLLFGLGVQPGLAVTALVAQAVDLLVDGLVPR